MRKTTIIATATIAIVGATLWILEPLDLHNLHRVVSSPSNQNISSQTQSMPTGPHSSSDPLSESTDLVPADLQFTIKNLEERIEEKSHLVEFDRIAERISDHGVGEEERAGLFARIEEVAKLRQQLIDLLEEKIEQELTEIQ